MKKMIFENASLELIRFSADVITSSEAIINTAVNDLAQDNIQINADNPISIFND